jgi:hypothetical protein
LIGGRYETRKRFMQNVVNKQPFTHYPRTVEMLTVRGGPRCDLGLVHAWLTEAGVGCLVVCRRWRRCTSGYSGSERGELSF